jgi:3-oxoacyl-[acyl-carrier-protein] synthase II
VRDPAQTIVATGMGALSACGNGVPALWRGLLSGRSAISAFDVFEHDRQRTHVAGQAPVPGGDSRAAALALVAAREAVAQAGAEPEALGARAGVCFGSSNGGLLESEGYYLARRSGLAASVRQIVGRQHSGPGEALARAQRIRGPVLTLATACVASSMAIANACDWLREGVVDLVLAGGADSLCRITYAGFNCLRAVSAGPSQPFRSSRDGLSLGEGAAVLVLETEQHALARGAVPLARILGAAATCDASHMSAPSPDGSGAASAIEQALSAAGLAPADVDFVDAHGTGTPLNDAAEAQALARVFGPGRVPVTSTKAVTGHLLGASGALEAIATIAGLQSGLVHPVPGDGPADPELHVDLVVGSPRRLQRSAVGVSTNLAFGGANTALVFGRVQPESER